MRNGNIERVRRALGHRQGWIRDVLGLKRDGESFRGDLSSYFLELMGSFWVVCEFFFLVEFGFFFDELRI